jgi:hypothetical protein
MAFGNLCPNIPDNYVGEGGSLRLFQVIKTKHSENVYENFDFHTST